MNLAVQSTVRQRLLAQLLFGTGQALMLLWVFSALVSHFAASSTWTGLLIAGSLVLSAGQLLRRDLLTTRFYQLWIGASFFAVFAYLLTGQIESHYAVTATVSCAAGMLFYDGLLEARSLKPARARVTR